MVMKLEVQVVNNGGKLSYAASDPTTKQRFDDLSNIQFQPKQLLQQQGNSSNNPQHSSGGSYSITASATPSPSLLDWGGPQKHLQLQQFQAHSRHQQPLDACGTVRNNEYDPRDNSPNKFCRSIQQQQQDFQNNTIMNCGRVDRQNMSSSFLTRHHYLTGSGSNRVSCLSSNTNAATATTATATTWKPRTIRATVSSSEDSSEASFVDSYQDRQDRAHRHISDDEDEGSDPHRVAAGGTKNRRSARNGTTTATTASLDDIEKDVVESLFNLRKAKAVTPMASSTATTDKVEPTKMSTIMFPQQERLQQCFSTAARRVSSDQLSLSSSSQRTQQQPRLPSFSSSTDLAAMHQQQQRAFEELQQQRQRQHQIEQEMEQQAIRMRALAAARYDLLLEQQQLQLEGAKNAPVRSLMGMVGSTCNGQSSLLPTRSLRQEQAAPSTVALNLKSTPTVLQQQPQGRKVSMTGADDKTNDVDEFSAMSSSNTAKQNKKVTRKKNDVRSDLPPKKRRLTSLGSSKQERRNSNASVTTNNRSQALKNSKRSFPTTNSEIVPIQHARTNDVLSGRGNGVAAFAGNVQFREFVRQAKENYCSAPRHEKGIITRAVIERVKRLDPPGRFLEKDPSSSGSAGVATDGSVVGGGFWVEVPMCRVVDKTSQALREGSWKAKSK